MPQKKTKRENLDSAKKAKFCGEFTPSDKEDEVAKFLCPINLKSER